MSAWNFVQFAMSTLNNARYCTTNYRNVVGSHVYKVPMTKLLIVTLSGRPTYKYC